MRITFEQRRIVVTGAAHGLGRAIALAFSKLGAGVVACDILADEIAETARLAGPGCRAEPLDVTDEIAVQSLIDRLEQAGQGPDILVNSAGGVMGQTGRPIENISWSDWQSILDVNLTGCFAMAKAVTPGMKSRRFGRIINIASGAGLTISLTGIQAYASAKAGQIGLTRQLAHELGAWNITVNAIAPGFIRSNPSSERQWHAMGEAGQARLLDSIAVRRLGTPDDIVNAVLFFCSNQAAWISGQTLAVDGGK